MKFDFNLKKPVLASHDSPLGVYPSLPPETKICVLVRPIQRHLKMGPPDDKCLDIDTVSQNRLNAIQKS